MLIFGIVVTLVWVLGLTVAVWLNLGKALELSLNEWGDFLAGGFAPLAFLWLVIGYFQQGKELRLSTNALKMQAEELRNSVEQQRELVKATYDDIAFAKAEAEALKNHERKKAQPIFRYSYSRFRIYKNGNRDVVFSIFNYGCEAKDVSVEIAEGGFLSAAQETNYKWQVWKRDEDIAICFDCGEGDLDLIDSLEFDVLFLDGLGDRQRRKLSFALNNKQVVSLVVSDVCLDGAI